MKRILLLTAVFIMMLGTNFSSAQTDADNFYKSDLVSVEKVSFSNQYKMKVAGNLFLPKNMKEGDKYPAIIVGHPMGAVKEQSANLYATKMAERGFVTLSIDLSFWGGSEGEPRNAVLPEVYAEDFSAAVDFLGTRPFVDRNLIGVIGICGSGSFAISAAKIDPRLKAIATHTDKHPYTLLGVKLLQYGKVTIDYPRGRFYFEAFQPDNEINNQCNNFDLTVKDGDLYVSTVWSSTKGKIEVGDKVIKINGKPTKKYDFCESILNGIPELKEKKQTKLTIETASGIKNIIYKKE